MGILNLHTLWDTSDNSNGVVRGNLMYASRWMDQESKYPSVKDVYTISLHATNYTKIEQLKTSGLLSHNLTWYS